MTDAIKDVNIRQQVTKVQMIENQMFPLDVSKHREPWFTCN